MNKYISIAFLIMFIGGGRGFAQVQLGSDIDGEVAYDNSGWSVSINSDGDRVAIGAPYNDGSFNNAGHVRVYEYSGSSWSKLGSDIDGEAAGDESGYSVSMNSDGDRVAIGATLNDGSDPDAGHVRVYALIAVTFTDGSSFTPSVTQGETNQAFGRFALTGAATGNSLTAATIRLNGTRTGATNFKLWSSSNNSFGSDTQLGSTVAADPGTGNTVSFSGFTSSIGTSAGYYFITCDVAADASGVIKGVLVQNSSLSMIGELSGSISNAVLSSGDVSLPVELTSFNVLSTRSDAVTLQWVTESEINNLGFILDRRVPGTEWTEIATYITHPELQGQGSVTHQTIYSYTDNTVLSAETYDYRLADVDYDGNKVYHSMTVMGVSPNDVVPETFTLYPAYPNPFNPVTTIRFDIPEGAANLLSLRIFDINGGLVETLMDGQREPGIYTVQWDGSDQPSGVYFVKIESSGFVQTKKMVLLK